MAGLSRKKDYGSKKKPYPSVKSGQFAGKNRSYPIPTRADAVDALRLAGLHGRDDVRDRVLKKYPGLKKKAYGGYTDYESNRSPVLSWSNLLTPMDNTNNYPLGGLITGGIQLITGLVRRQQEKSLAKQQAMFEERGQNIESLNRMPAGSQGVVPGVANPYMLALGGMSSKSINPENYLTEYNAGGRHEQNSLGGVPLGVNSQGEQNTVEEGEASFDFKDGKYIFSNRLIV